MGRSRTSKLKLQIEYQNRAVKLASRDMQAIRNEAVATDRTLNQLGKSDGLDNVASDARKAVREVDRLEDALNRARSANDRFDDVSRGVGLAGDVQSNLGAVSGLAGVAGAGGVSTGISTVGEFAVLLEELPRLKTAVAGLPQTARAAVGALGPVGLGLSAAVVGLTAAAVVASRQISKARENFERAVKSFEEFDRFSITGTTDEAREALTEYQRDLDASTATLARVRDAFNQLDTRGQRAVARLLGVGKQIQDLETQQAEAQRQVDLYSAAIEGNAFAANDAARAQDEYNQSLQNFLDINSRSRLDAQRFLADEGTTSDDVDRRIREASTDLELIGNELRNNQTISESYRAELVRQQQELTAFINTLKSERGDVDARTAFQEGTAALEEAAEIQRQIETDLARDRIATIQQASAREQEYLRLQRESTVEGVGQRIEALESERAALQQTIAELEPLAAENVEYAMALARARDELRQVNSDIDRTFTDVLPSAVRRSQQQLAADIARIQSESLTKIRDILRDQQQKEADALRERDRSVADAQRNAATERADALREASQEIVDIERDVQRERQRIQRDFGRSLSRAQAERDALAAFEAEQQRDDELTDLQESGQERRAEVQRQLDDQNRQIDRALREQTRIANQRYTEQLRTARRAAEVAIRTEQEKARAEIATRQQAARAELSILSQGANQAVSIVNNQVNGINQALSQIGRGFSSSVSRSSSSSAAAQNRAASTTAVVDRRLNQTLSTSKRSLSSSRSAARR